MKAIKLITVVILSLGLGTACAKSTSEPEAAVAPAPESTAPAAAMPSSSQSDEQSSSGFSEGMRIPVDGSSLEAFNKSLETIKSKVTPDEYTNLANAIEYLLVYDIGARHNREKLAKNLDGQTGEEIVGQAGFDR